MRVKRRAKVQETIPSSSMADIAFLLIVFFMVTTTFSTDRTRVVLPESRNREEIPRSATIIAIKQTGEIRIEGEEATMSDIQPQAELEILQNRHSYFVIKADKNTPYEYIDDVFEQLRLARVRNLSLPTLQELEE